MPSVRARTAGLLAALAVTLAAGCGDETQPARHAVSIRPTASGPPPVSAADRRDAQLARLEKRKRLLKGTVRGFYRDLAAQDFETAWSRLSPELQSFLGSFERWQHGYRDTISTSPHAIAVTNADSHEANLAFQLRTVDLDACADRVARRFRATWRLSRTDGEWIVAEIHAQQVAGATPVRRVSNCPGLQPPPDPPGGPAYVPPDEPPAEEDLPDPPNHSEPLPALPRRPTTQNFGQGTGRIGTCRDGTTSDSIGRSGACSYHGGVGP